MLQRWNILGVVTALAVAPLLAINIDWYTSDTGGVLSSSQGTIELSGTIGQLDAGPPMSGGTYELVGGFWADAGRPLPGDCDANGVVLLNDFACFTICFTGPGGVASDECTPFDFDADADVDGHDLLLFLAQLAA